MARSEVACWEPGPGVRDRLDRDRVGSIQSVGEVQGWSPSQYPPLLSPTLPLLPPVCHRSGVEWKDGLHVNLESENSVALCCVIPDSFPIQSNPIRGKCANESKAVRAREETQDPGSRTHGERRGEVGLVANEMKANTR
jgi:hypothetical protein